MVVPRLVHAAVLLVVEMLELIVPGHKYTCSTNCLEMACSGTPQACNQAFFDKWLGPSCLFFTAAKPLLVCAHLPQLLLVSQASLSQAHAPTPCGSQVLT